MTAPGHERTGNAASEGVGSHALAAAVASWDECGAVNRKAEADALKAAARAEGYDGSNGIIDVLVFVVGYLRDEIWSLETSASLAPDITRAAREAMKRITGGNCTFVDDDISVLELLAWGAIREGLAPELIPNMATKAGACFKTHPFTLEKAAEDGGEAVHAPTENPEPGLNPNPPEPEQWSEP